MKLTWTHKLSTFRCAVGVWCLLLMSLSCAKPEPTAPGNNETARDLAQKVFGASGGPRLNEVAELRFTFIYFQGEQKVFEAKHFFDLKAYRSRVLWTDRKGVKRDAVIEIHKKTGVGTIDGVPATGEALTELINKTYARWVNDAYWLLMPLKLLDPGVNLTKEEPRTINNKQHSVLKMSFGGVGLTPGDVYWLYIDPQSHRIERWEMKLQGQPEPPEPVSWEDYRAVGPLWLAFDHKEASGRVLFEAVEALPVVSEDDFRLPVQ